ncbi:MAG TPA: lipid A deacylase LpxR family protein [Longimicrobium sp.]
MIYWRTRVRIPASMLVLALLWVVPVGGQGVRSVTLRLDNDILALRGRGAPADYDYTQGLVLGVELDSASRWMPGRLPACDATGTEVCVRTRIEAGQRIYTPRRDASNPIPGERPYAAWLYLGGGIARESGRGVRSLEVELGATGPPAMGEWVQNGVHRLTGSERQEGWAHQTGFEPGILLRFQEGRRWDGGAARVEPAISVELGNVRTAAAVGASGVLGRGTGPYARLGGRLEWVVRDIFLDGSTFGSRSTARKLPFVREGEAAVGFRARKWSAEYRFVARSREYRAQPERHAYGSLVLTVAR